MTRDFQYLERSPQIASTEKFRHTETLVFFAMRKKTTISAHDKLINKDVEE
jgi:hypothetical protein